jgi:heptosyltransferase-2
MSAPSRIAVFLPNWVGDVVMTTPTLRALRARFPAARLVGVLKPYVADVLEGTPWLDERVLLGGGRFSGSAWSAAVARLRRGRTDLAVLLRNSFHAALLAWLGGCRRRVGYARDGRSVLLSDPLAAPTDAGGRRFPSPVIEAYNRIAEYVGCPAPGYRLELATTPADEQMADTVWAQFGLGSYREVIGFNPGGAFGSAKHWPVEHFAELARQLVDCRGSGVLVVCGPDERATARKIVALSGRPAVCSLADRSPSLGLTKACVRRADLLITTDSGPRHFAAAFGRPVLTLFGPTHTAWSETYYPHQLHLQQQVDCGPCQRRVCPLDHRCMRGLSPGEVRAAAEQLLRRRPQDGNGSSSEAA